MPKLFLTMTPDQWRATLFFSIAGYLCGSFLSAYYLPLWLRHIDVTNGARDRNPGAANAFLQAGIPCGILVLLCELGKGTLPVLAASRCLPVGCPGFIPVMLAPVIGHAWSCFYGGGGKAIAVSFGVLIGLLPEGRPLLLLIFFYLLFTLVLKIPSHTRRTIVTFALWMIATAVLVRQATLVIGCAGIGCIVIYKHMKALHHEHKSPAPEEKTV